MNDTVTKHCLIVDDSNVTRKVVRHIFQSLGFVIYEAENGQEAINRCRHKNFDAIFLDWNMPIMDGIDFLLALRSENGGNEPKVIFCTTENDAERITQAFNAGADGYILKPFDPEIVERKLQEVGLI